MSIATRRGIRQTKQGTWAVIVQHVNSEDNAVLTTRLVAEFSGIGAKRQAINKAGSNRVVA